MFENYTYEYILNTILSRISNADGTLDVREGSALWYAVAPVAAELAIAYANCDRANKESFVGTATREGMYLACNDIGLDTNQFEASASAFYGHFNVEVTIGSRWACGDYIFVVESSAGTIPIDGVNYYRYRLVCETVGSQSQYTSGTLRPITEYGSAQLKVAVLDECILVGADETPDEKVRETYFDYIANKAESANIAQYNQWLNEFEGIGAHKIIPNWDGANTVKAVILNENKERPTKEFIASVQEYLDPNSEGMGEGKAPIGAKVTVEGGTAAYIDVKATLTLSSGDASTADIVDRLTAYFRKISFQKSVINIYEVANIIWASDSVLDVHSVELGRWVDGTTTNYSPTNLTLEPYEAPMLHEFYTE